MTRRPEEPNTDQLLAEVLTRGPGRPPLSCELTVDRYWRSPPDQVEHRVSYAVATDPVGSPAGDPADAAIQVTVDGTRFCLDDPVRLLPVEIPKPWGRELWFTGMEARGESRVLGRDGSLGLGSYLALAPGRLTSHEQPILLKILDPRSEPVLGELYLEVHAHKQEVYVVTAVSHEAWPAGRGRIRFAVDQRRRHQFGSDAGFRRAFLQAVQDYEAIRRKIEAGESGLDSLERKARETALAFIGERELEPGDVVSVPTWVPHALQHGVQVVEFQTPTYERFIISSTQKVLTQDGWDSEHAIAHMRLDCPPEPRPETVAEGTHRIARLAGFGVWRAVLAPDRSLALPSELPYALAYCIRGSIRLHGACGQLLLRGGEAALVPGKAVAGTASRSPITGAPEGLLLLAAPGL